MWPFKKGKNPEKEIDVNKPVENPKLLAAFERHRNERTENSATNVANAIFEATYLAPILPDEMKTSPSNSSGKINIEKGSLIKFLNCFDDNENCFFPIFTDWNEIKAWTDQPVDSIILSSEDVFYMSGGESFSGAVINPGTIGWTLSKENIAAIKEDFHLTTK